MSRTLPLFPLEAILYPGVLMPLRIFQPRYLQLLEELQSGPGREFGIIGLRSGSSSEVISRPDLYDVGCVATLHRVRESGDDAYDVTILGHDRFRLLDLVDEGKPYVCGRIEPFADRPSESEDAEALASENLVLFAKYVRGVASIRGRTSIEVTEANLPADPPALSWLMASAARLPRPEKQQILETDTDVQRLRLQRVLLTRELALIDRLGSLPAGPEDLPQESGRN